MNSEKRIDDIRYLISKRFKEYDLNFYSDLTHPYEIDQNHFFVSHFHNSFKYSEYYAHCNNSLELGDISFILSKCGVAIARIGLRIDKTAQNYKLFTFSDCIYLPDITWDCSDSDARRIYEEFIDLLAGELAVALKTDIKVLIPNTTIFTWLGSLITKYSDKVLLLTSILNNLTSFSGSNTNRKSYRNLINFASKHYDLETIISRDQFKMDEYRLFHSEVAGRTTRDARSWRVQENWVKNGTAFISECRFGGVLLGYSFVEIFGSRALYFSGVYSRDTKYKGISHACLNQACNFARKINLNTFELGQIASSEDDNKLQNIAHFKVGFSNLLQLNSVLNIPVRNR